MKRFALLALASGMAISAAVPANATILAPGSTGLSFSAIDATTRGTLIAGTTLQAGSANTINGTVLSAVYRNTFNTLDFYFQVTRTGGMNEIDGLNVSAYNGYTVDALVDGTDFDGAGGFAATNNGFLADGTTPSGSTTRVGRSNDGAVNRVDFGINGLSGSENSATYIFRTNAVNFSFNGNATVSNSTSFNVLAYQPAAAVPEPATWGMMIMGFGLMGGVLRRRSTKVAFA